MDLEAPEDITVDPVAPEDTTEGPAVPDSAVIITDRPCRLIIPTWVVDGTVLTVTEDVAVAYSP